MTVVVIGASAGLGRALSTQLAADGHDLILLATDIRDLAPLCAHLALTNGISACSIAVDASDPNQLAAMLQTEFEKTDSLTAVFAPIGVAFSGDEVTLSTEKILALLNINLLSVMTAIQTALPYLKKQKAARIVGFGSIATIRGRGRNIAYSAAKRGLASYFESLRHALVGYPIVVQFYQLGYVKTQQLHGQQTALPSISPEKAAMIILADENCDFGERYLPTFWKIVAMILKILPWAIFSRSKF